MPDSNEASSAATPVADAKAGSGNLNIGQAAAALMARFAQPATPEPATETVATDKNAPDEAAPAAETESDPKETVAEADVASVEPESEAKANAVDTSAPAAPEEEEDSEVPSQSSALKFTPEQQKIFEKRVAKEIKKTDAVRAKMAALEARNAELEAKVIGDTAPAAPATPPTAPVPAPSNVPLPEYNDLASLGQLQTQAKQAIRWAEEVLDAPSAWKTRVDSDPLTGEESTVRFTMIGDKAFSEADVKRVMKKAKLTLEDEIPAKANFVTQRQQAEQVARQTFPFLSDRTSPEYVQAQSMLRDPWVAQRPDAEWIVGVTIRGLKALEADHKKAGEAKTKQLPKVKPASDQTVVSTAVSPARTPVATSVRQAMESEQGRLKSKGGITAAEAAASLVNRERIRNSR